MSIRLHTASWVDGSDGTVLPIVFAPDQTLSEWLSTAGASMADGGLASQTLPSYFRGALNYADYAWRQVGPTYCSLVLGKPDEVLRLVSACIKHLGGRLSKSRHEDGVWQVSASLENTDRINKTICGTYHLYSALIAAGLYMHVHPLEIPKEQRQVRNVPGINHSAPKCAPRFRLRISPPANAALRTDSAAFLPNIIPALQSYGAPPAVVMAARVMGQGLSRIGEQLSLTMLDWWDSQFGLEISTPNKGDGSIRTKIQLISQDLRSDLAAYVDQDRILNAKDRNSSGAWLPGPMSKELSPDGGDRHCNGLSLLQWKHFLSDPRIPLSERQRIASQAPLFPNAKGNFYTRSGFVDYWYRPAMRAASLPTRTHYLRHCGVNDFLAYLASQPLSADEHRHQSLQFGRMLGWKWPLAMLERYSLPERRRAQLESVRAFQAQRLTGESLRSSSKGSILQKPTAKPVSRLARFAGEGGG